ncbi:UDP-N-acetylmuramoyl-L-alanyl-D-glutamate--2,6-diaminopimelate ligase [Candidatus Amoebophilus asiaticus]|uniref:UDP-N-acetylmuramoyl-L-alanyl-D-glutamate--2, 6-diaminopimelate ligase n=1 Tax=Candidatus Amoebophilus asiaticus TaxID=281120 RepID=UPI00164EFA2E|nr:UDP-N-acetylmuramoyl-L-alanyl-D-glutamate--2,6-diaminopimelate ligase [Candidatus Amoebophilus asiaticus]
MILQELLNKVSVQQIIGDTNLPIKSICLDSREAEKDSLFIALPGSQVDGHQYIADAIALGSKAIICEKYPEHLATHVTYIQVSNVTQALGTIASNFYKNPSTKLKLVAVTGTSGKTSTVHLLYRLFRQLGYSVGMLSTIHNQINDQAFPSTLTTPNAIDINKALAQMVTAGCQFCFMEASSHAIVQNRLAGLELAGALFLNISHDHLDYHLTFDAYIQAKKKLFDELTANAFVLYNIDDKRGKIMIQNTRATTYSMAIQRPADFTAQVLANTWQGLELRIGGQNVWFQLLGTFNASNLLAAYATACLLGQPSQDILVALSSIKPITGRFQHIHTPKKPDVIIDYAHKPEALEKILLSIQQIRESAKQQGKIITIIGCGGNRDTQKRPMMARIAYKLSDQLILTSDNPRYEDPKAIIEEMKQGLRSAEQLKTITIIDRAEAIQAAYQMAQPADIILIAGKGHENYQEIAGIKYPLSDEEIVSKLMAV